MFCLRCLLFSITFDAPPKIDTFSYYKTERQTLNIRQSDVVRELNYYEWYNAGIVLENQGKQGDFVYYLKRKTRDNK
jgi:hypothetical protein